MKNNSFSLGIAIIAIGIFILLGKLGVFQFIASFLWPAAVVISGLVLNVLYFNRTVPAQMLIPAGMLVTYGLMFLYCTIFGWGHMSYLWPGFIFGVAVGLYEYYIFAEYRHRSYFLAALILAVISAVFFTMSIMTSGIVYVVAAGLIIIGGALVLRRPNHW